jgi:hypothetical protein
MTVNDRRRRPGVRARLALFVAGLALVGLAGGCAKAAVSPPPPKTDASVSAKSGRPVLSIQVDPVRASTGATIAATVSYRNASSQPYRFVAEYNVRVTDATGKVLFDSFAREAAKSMIVSPPPTISDLAPGETTSGTVELRLKAPGNYDVVAFTRGVHPNVRNVPAVPQLRTPPVPVVVSAQ